MLINRKKDGEMAQLLWPLSHRTQVQFPTPISQPKPSIILALKGQTPSSGLRAPPQNKIQGLLPYGEQGGGDCTRWEVRGLAGHSDLTGNGKEYALLG